VLQCVAVCCSALQCDAVCCSLLQCVASVFCGVLQCVALCCGVLQCVAVCCSVLQVCCSVLQMCCSVLHCVAHVLQMCSSVLRLCCKCVASVLQVYYSTMSTMLAFQDLSEFAVLRRTLCIKVGLGISRTNVDSQWNSVYKAFHRIRSCANEPIGW